MDAVWFFCIMAVTFSKCNGFVPILMIDDTNQAPGEAEDEDQVKSKYLEPSLIQPTQNQMRNPEEITQNQTDNQQKNDQNQNTNLQLQNPNQAQSHLARNQNNRDPINNDQAQKQSDQAHYKNEQDQNRGNYPTLNSNPAPIQVNQARNPENLARNPNNPAQRNPAQSQTKPAPKQIVQNHNRSQEPAQIRDQNQTQKSDPKHRRNMFKRFEIRQRTDDDDVTNNQPKQMLRMPQNPSLYVASNTQNRQKPAMDAIQRIEKMFHDFIKTKALPSDVVYRAQQDYDMKPSLIKFRSADHPSLKLELTSKSLIKFLASVLSSPAAGQYADMAGEQAAVAFRALSSPDTGPWSPLRRSVDTKRYVKTEMKQ